MRTCLLGSDGPRVPVVGFGGMPLSTEGRPSEHDAIRVLHSVFDAGLTLIDTADVYCLDDNDIGHNERLVAKALASWEGDQARVIVATKGGLTRPQGRWECNAHPKHLRSACERSLLALGVETIALYQLHAPDPQVPFADSIGTLTELHQAGKIERIGLSNVSVAEIRQAMSQVPIATVQNRLNPFFREALDTGVVDFCAQQRISFLAYSPVGGGRLNKKLPHHPVLQPIALRHGISTHVVALAWVLSKSPNVIVIPGARTVGHARNSVMAGDVILSDEELAAIDAAEFSRV